MCYQTCKKQIPIKFSFLVAHPFDEQKNLKEAERKLLLNSFDCVHLLYTLIMLIVFVCLVSLFVYLKNNYLLKKQSGFFKSTQSALHLMINENIRILSQRAIIAFFLVLFMFFHETVYLNKHQNVQTGRRPE